MTGNIQYKTQRDKLRMTTFFYQDQIQFTELDTRETMTFQVRSGQRQLGIPPCFPHPTGPRVESSMWAGRAASMSLSNQGIHCCSESGYSLTTGPHPALLAVHCCFEQSCLLMPGSLTWISRESFLGEGKRNARGEEKKASYTTTICFSCVFSARQSPCNTKLMGEIV